MKKLVNALVLALLIASCGQPPHKEVKYQLEESVDYGSKCKVISNGMSELDVKSIMGKPTSIEYAPFDSKLLPKSNECPGAALVPCNVKRAVKRVTYGKRFVVSEERKEDHNLVVFYDSAGTVCCAKYDLSVKETLGIITL